jgi:hypothetical protein
MILAALLIGCSSSKELTYKTLKEIHRVSEKHTKRYLEKRGFHWFDSINNYANFYTNKEVVILKVSELNKNAVQLSSRKEEVISKLFNNAIEHGFYSITRDDCLLDHTKDTLVKGKDKLIFTFTNLTTYNVKYEKTK